MEPQIRKIAMAGVGMVAVMAVATWLRSSYDVEWSPAALRELVKGAGIWGPVLFILMVSIRPLLVIPSQLFLISAGVCFGTFDGALYAALGLTLGAVFTFGLTHWIGRDAALARMPTGLRSALENVNGFPAIALLFLGMAYPIGPVLWFSVGAALAGMALPGFIIAVFTGGFVRASAYAFFGSTLVDAELHEMLLGGVAIFAVALLPLLHPRVRMHVRRLLRED